MRILTRYILGEVVSHALIGAAVFTFVLFTRDLGRILELVVRNSAPLPSVAEIFFFTVPVALTYTIPMGVLVGILIGLSRLAADSEITAMRASGLGRVDFPARDLNLRGGGMVARSRQQRLSRAALTRRPRTTPEPPQVFSGFFRSPAPRVLRGIPEDRPLRAGRQRQCPAELSGKACSSPI